jgi:hypothetical protein
MRIHSFSSTWSVDSFPLPSPLGLVWLWSVSHEPKNCNKENTSKKPAKLSNRKAKKQRKPPVVEYFLAHLRATFPHFHYFLPVSSPILDLPHINAPLANQLER